MYTFMYITSHTIGQLINPTVNRDAMRASAAGEAAMELVNNQTEGPDLSLDIYLPETYFRFPRLFLTGQP